MNWRSTLQSKTRQPAFLWRMVAWIIAAGIVAGYAAQYFCAPEPQGKFAAETSKETSRWDKIERWADQGEWSKVWWAIPASQQWRLQNRATVALAALTGCCWLVFLLQALQVGGVRDGRLWLAIVGVLLGVLSIWPTQFFNLWQETGWGLRESRKLIPGLRYNVLGVGLREEFAKLLCLLPLIPVLLRLRSELAALLVSGSVGIGFALAENAGYFASSGGTSVMGRYLTANPLHMTLTGLIGLALFRGLRQPRDWGPHALATFGLMVFAHGIYDALIDLPALADYAMLGTIVFALVVYQFFRELRSLRTTRREMVSLTANFLCGVSLVTAATFVYLSATVGCPIAFDVLASGVIGLAVMVYLFLREMPETMIRV